MLNKSYEKLLNIKKENVKKGFLTGVNRNEPIIDMKKSNFAGVKFDKKQIVYLSNFDFTGSDFSNTSFNGIYFMSDSIFKNCKFKNSIMSPVFGLDANFENSDFTNANLSFSDFTSANFKNCIFKNALIIDTKMMSADLSNCDFKDAVIKKSNFYGSNVKNADFRNVKELAISDQEIKYLKDNGALLPENV